MSLAKICALYANLDLSVTPGALAQAMDRLAAKAAATYEALKAELAAEAVISHDETGWRVGPLNAWLWAFAASTITIYAICDGRGFDEGHHRAARRFRRGVMPRRIGPVTQVQPSRPSKLSGPPA